MPRVRLILGLKSHRKVITGKKVVHHAHHTKTGGALKHMLHHMEPDNFGSNLNKLRHSLKTMHISHKASQRGGKGKKRYIEI